MLVEDENKKIVLKHIDSSVFISIKELKDRIIITLKASAEKSDTDMLKQELLELNPTKKINIIYMAEKKEDNTASDKWIVKGVKHIIAVASGKGGVGKSTTSVNLALALANKNLKVALFDADIYGPSIPLMLGYNAIPPTSLDGKILEPYKECGIASMSIGSMIKDDTALIWRGAKACGAIEQLLTGTNWGEIDIMIVDMPPGTGDIQITMSQKIDFSGAIIVSTPQDVALIDAIKGINLFKKIEVPVLGVIENMSYYVCEKCGHRIDIFGHAGAAKTAQAQGIEFLGEIPLNYEIRLNSDQGTPIVQSAPNSLQTKAYEDIAQKLIDILKL